VLAYSEGVFNTIKFGHVLLAVVWVGGGLFVQYYATRLSHEDDPVRISGFTKDVEKAGTQYFMPASGLVLVFGIAMVVYSPVYNFSDTWIAIGLIGYAATFVTGAFFIGPTAGKLGKAIEAEGPEGATTQALRKRIFTISRIDQVVLTLVIADMVIKPGR
jgi:uncharacterized membrane protein